MTDDRMRRVPTHIPGLDAILEGGFLSGGVYILEGPPGAGKTTMGSQFCFGHAANGGRALYMTLLAEEHTRLLGHLERMAFFDPGLVPHRVNYVSAFKVLEAEGLNSVLKTARHAIAAQKTTALVLDGLSSAEEASPSVKDFKKFIHELQIITSMTGCTALLLSSPERPGGSRPERTMVDGILELQDAIVGQHAVRHLVVRKMRGTAQLRGRHYMEITNAGVRVVPRIEASELVAQGEPTTVGPKRMSVGLPELDAMLSGGLLQGSTTALLGPSGSGKTIFGLHFLHAGFARDEPGLCFGFFERPAAIIGKTHRLNMSFASAVETGRVELHWQRPIEGVIDMLAERLLESVRRCNAKRVFIDGLQGFQAAVPDDPGRLREVLSCVSSELESMGVTTLYTADTPDLCGDNLQLAILGMSSVTQNILLLRHREEDLRLARHLSIVKLRDSAHDQHVREFVIADDGIRLTAAAGQDAVRSKSRALSAPSADDAPSRRRKATSKTAGKSASKAKKTPPKAAAKRGVRKRS